MSGVWFGIFSNGRMTLTGICMCRWLGIFLITQEDGVRVNVLSQGSTSVLLNLTAATFPRTANSLSGVQRVLSTQPAYANISPKLSRRCGNSQREKKKKKMGVTFWWRNDDQWLVILSLKNGTDTFSASMCLLVDRTTRGVAQRTFNVDVWEEHAPEPKRACSESVWQSQKCSIFDHFSVWVVHTVNFIFRYIYIHLCIYTHMYLCTEKKGGGVHASTLISRNDLMLSKGNEYLKTRSTKISEHFDGWRTVLPKRPLAVVKVRSF